MDAATPRARGRRAARTPRRADASRAKLTLYLDAELARRFAVHATMTGVDRSELFAEMVRTTCRRFVVSDRERPGEGQGRGDDAISGRSDA